MEGFGVTNGWSADEDWERQLPVDAPVLHIRGIAYKGTIETSTRPPAAGDRGPRSGMTGRPLPVTGRAAIR